MTPAALLAQVVRPCLARLGPPYASPEAELMLVAVNRQEDAGCTRCQVGGPARGLWMFQEDGLRGVLAHPRTRQRAGLLLSEYGIVHVTLEDDARLAWADLEHDDGLACALARLLLFTDPAPLPPVPATEADRAEAQLQAYETYTRLWRPGVRRPAAWPHSYVTALAAVRGEAGDA